MNGHGETKFLTHSKLGSWPCSLYILTWRLKGQIPSLERVKKLISSWLLIITLIMIVRLLMWMFSCRGWSKHWIESWSARCTEYFLPRTQKARQNVLYYDQGFRKLRCHVSASKIWPEGKIYLFNLKKSNFTPVSCGRRGKKWLIYDHDSWVLIPHFRRRRAIRRLPCLVLRCRTAPLLTGRATISRRPTPWQRHVWMPGRPENIVKSRGWCVKNCGSHLAWGFVVLATHKP